MPSPDQEAFESTLSVDSAVESLSSALLPFLTLSPFRHGLVGTVTPKKVSLRYSGPFNLDSGLKFSGSFTVANGACVLRGHFTRPRVLLAWLWFFLGIHVLGAVGILLFAGPSAWRGVGFPGFGAALGTAALLFHRACEHRDRRQIRRALTELLRGGG